MSPDAGPRFESQHRVPDALVRSQLEMVLASELFSRSERLSGFLRFVVEETLNGRGETLKEPVLAHQLYGKNPDFDGANNPVVRVDARRLRDKLREYYADRRPIPSSSRCRKAAMCRPSSSSRAPLLPPMSKLSQREGSPEFASPNRLRQSMRRHRHGRECPSGVEQRLRLE